MPYASTHKIEKKMYLSKFRDKKIVVFKDALDITALPCIVIRCTDFVMLNEISLNLFIHLR